MEWNDETIARLRQLWEEGLSTAEIGRRLGVSKNAVVGKAHRLLLPPRPSPIRRDQAAAPRPAAPRRVTGPTLPPLPAAPPERAMPERAMPERIAAEPAPRPIASAEPAPVVSLSAPLPPIEIARPEALRAAPPPPPPIRVVSQASARHTACCWPLGEPGTRSFRFCDGASLPGKPYCGEHAQLAYVKVRDRREEAAA